MAAADIFVKERPLLGFAASLRWWMRQKRALPAQDEEETRARLDFILEMMDTHPEALASEESMRSCALYFSGRF